MSNESNRSAGKHTEQTSRDLKASDFFPPGEGWNRGESKPEIIPDDGPTCGPTVDPKPN